MKIPNKIISFNQFCHETCDGLYDPKFSDDVQCNGYKQLKKMVVEGIKPASLEETERWEKYPTLQELTEEPNIKYLRFLHPILRPVIIEYWDAIKILPL